MTHQRQIIVLASLALAAQCAIAAPAKPAPLAVVRTWGDLLAQKPISLTQPSPAQTSGPTYRLGIDRTDAKLYGAVVVYCIAQGGGDRFGDGEDLGPFLVRLQWPKQQAARREMVFQPQLVDSNAGAVLYMKSIPLDTAGDYTIMVQGPAADGKAVKPETIAQAVVHVPSKPETLWSPWPLNAADGTVGLLARDDDPSYAAIGVANPSAGVAVPKIHALSPAILEKLPDPDLLLPQIFPTKPDAGMQLTVVGSLLILNMDEGIQPEYPDEKFLTRWWINGKPFVPNLAFPEFSNEYEMRHNGAQAIVPLATEVCFQVEFHPEILGVKKGDTIGVQLLLCPDGWEDSGPDPALAQVAELWARPHPTDGEHIHIARLTNRVDFVYSGDPAGMAAESPSKR